AWRNPRAAIIRQMFDDPTTTAGYAPAPAPNGSLPAPSTPSGFTGPPQRSLSLGERPPIDSVAT
ncbi:MAG: Sec-independent protein translocase TatB, partial [Pseudonocardiaceae bacterium]